MPVKVNATIVTVGTNTDPNTGLPLQGSLVTLNWNLTDGSLAGSAQLPIVSIINEAQLKDECKTDLAVYLNTNFETSFAFSDINLP
jgi:hypothetical protein